MSKPNTDKPTEALPESPTKKNKKSLIGGLIFLLIITAAVLVFIFNLNDFNKTMSAITSISFMALLPALICLALYILVFPLSLCVLNKVKNTKASFMDSYLIGASEHFFNGITPYQTGAQPFQVYSYTQRGVKAGDGTGIVITNYIAQLIAANSFMLISLIFSGDFFGSFQERGMVWIPILGVVMNLLNLAVFLCIATCKWMRNIFTNLLKWLCHFKWIGKRFSKSIPDFEKFCDNAQSGSKEIMSHPIAFITAIIIRFVSLIFYFAIPFFILRSLNINAGYDMLIYSMLGTCFAINAIVWIPTPGTSGGIELSFTILFSLFAGFTGAIASAAAILWRGLTYYLLIIISFIEYMLLELSLKIKNRKKE